MKRVGQPDDDHAVMEERRVEAQDGRLLTTVLGRGAREDASNLSDKFALRPEITSAIEELAHLSRHVPKPSGRSEDDGIGVSLRESAGMSIGRIEEHEYFHCSVLFFAMYPLANPRWQTTTHNPCHVGCIGLSPARAVIERKSVEPNRQRIPPIESIRMSGSCFISNGLFQSFVPATEGF
jgi:hypothetical protein